MSFLHFGTDDRSGGVPQTIHVSAPAAHQNANPAVDKVLSRASEVAVMPQVVFKIMEITGADNSSAAVLEKSIMVDPGFSARILTQANSAYFSLPKRVTSIREAIVFVGFRAVRELAMTVGVFDMFLGRNDRGSLRRRTWWRQSLDTAVAAKTLAVELRACPAEEAFTCGLLHFIGKTLLERSDSNAYNKVEDLIGMGAADYLAETTVFGCDHLDINQAACRHWGFPEELVEGLEYLHPPLPGTEAAPLRAMTAICHVIAKLSTEGMPTADRCMELPKWALDVLGIKEGMAPSVVHRGHQAIADARVLMR